MSVMDLKSKGVTWVGSIYQKFETMCHDVDNIVSQDAVKYVEDQVHTVGQSMKKFYSDVVQDLIPSSVDPVNSEAQVRTQQRKASIGTHIKSMIGIEKDHGHTALLKQPPTAPSDFDPVMNQLGDEFSGHDLVNQSTYTSSGELLEGKEFESVPGSIDDVSTNQNSDLSTEENAFMEKSSDPELLEIMATGEKESFKASSEFIDCNYESACSFLAEVSPPTSAHGEKFQPCQNVGAVCLTSAGESCCVSDASTNEFKGKFSAPEVLEFMASGEKESYEASGDFTDCSHENEGGFFAEVLPSTSVHGEKFQPPQNEGEVCLTSADDSYCVSDAKSSAPEVLELMASGEKESYEASGEFIDCSHENVCGFLSEVLPSTSAHGEKFQPPQNEVEVCLASADDSYCVSNISTNAFKGKSSAPEVLELMASGEKESCEASSEFIDCSCENESGFLAEVSPRTSGHGEKFQSPQNVGANCFKSADNSYCVSDTSRTVGLSEMTFSIVSAEKKILDKELTSSSSSIFTEHYSLSENPLDNISTKVGSCSNSFNVTTHDSHCSSLLLSSTSAPTVSCEIKEMGLTSSNGVLCLESIGCSDDSSYMIDDLTESEMETIDLTDKVKLEESCVIVDDSLLYEVSRRTHKFRSYKQKIRDAFTSKKRLTKEYEQLAIWYGDLDIGSSQDTMQSGLSSNTTIILDSNLQTHRMHDFEWELL